MKKLIVTTCLCVLFTANFSLADWDPGDPNKMHYPQLPDPLGWDIYAAAPHVVADDWRCTSTGPVSDIHLWGSWKNDIEGTIDSIHVSIHKDVPADTNQDIFWSRPGDLLWERDFTIGQFTVRDYGQGAQGWYDPFTGEYSRENHTFFHQINIENIDAPFIQEQDSIYWLDISVTASSPAGAAAFWGWKTSLNHWNDDAVYYYQSPTGGDPVWLELIDPSNQTTSLDMAFVITPEPTTIALFGLGSLVLLRKKIGI
jgi:hypothetical protein